MKINFTKMHGAGNDFVCINNPEKKITLTPKQIQFLCDRHFGVGADGVILMEKNSDDADIFMNYYNADGSISEMCGNGVRCTAHFAKNFWNISSSVIQVETRSGIKPVELTDDGFRVNMGAANFSCPADFPENSREIENTQWNFASMGNPHAVGFFDSPEKIDEALPKVGGTVENFLEYFPNRINVNFVAPKKSVKNKHCFQVSTWERGAGPTLACGSGACASFAWIEKKFPETLGEKIQIDVPGGTLFFEKNKNNEIIMTGPSSIVFEGEIEA
jgi:diaminopimelate epimerase